LGKEEPDVRTVPRARALDRCVNSEALAGLTECSHVRFPVGLVEVDCKEPTGLVFEERIDPSHMSPLEMVEEYLVAYRYEGLVGAVPALDARLVA